MYENNVRLRPNSQFILNNLLSSNSSNSNLKRHDENNINVNENNLIKELVKEIKNSVSESRKVISGETAKIINNKIRKTNDNLNGDSILNFNLFPNSKNEKEKEKVNEEKKINKKVIFSIDNKIVKKKKITKDKQDQFLNRVKENIEKKKNKLIAKTAMVKDEEIKNTQFKPPEMNKLSKKILEMKHNKIKPIYERARDILENKDININFLKKMYIKDEENIRNQRTSSVGKIEKYDKRKFDEWVNKKMDWYQEKANKISQISEFNEKVENEAIRNYHNKNTSLDKSILSNQDKDKIFERLNKQNVGNIKLSKLVKHHCESLSPTPVSRSPRFKKDFANKSLNSSIDVDKIKRAKFYSCANSPRRGNEDIDNTNTQLVDPNNNQVIGSIKTLDDNANNEEIFNINKVNKLKFSYFRSNSVINRKTDDNYISSNLNDF